MAFFLIGLGLGDEKDITVRGLELVRSCDTVYLEGYTSVLLGPGVGDVGRLSEFYGVPVELADREAVECGAVLAPARAGKRVALLVVGDPYSATTHSDLAVRCTEEGIPCEAVHNATVLTAVGCTGLQLYRFGQCVSLCFWTETWKPDSWFSKVQANLREGLHTLCLLDIKVKEQSEENLARGRKIYEPPRFMTVQQGAQQLLELAQRQGPDCGVTAETLCVGVARLGHPSQKVLAAPLRVLAEEDFGEPLHSLIVCGEVHEPEAQHLCLYFTAPLREAYQRRLEEERQRRGL
eukprot:TRINITY_DN65223_c0_g1_i1.p1 TRINITY_DN65223_c0_g1~~TRINITY_DN65223_c0_g1_i1.p1  ORF type:complete len:319 (+),score=121.88 TRINITY_DN65223_c0_g1_i1:79-957(+)